MYRFLQNPIKLYTGWCHSFKMSWMFKQLVSLRRENTTSQSTRPCWPKQTPQTWAPQRRPPPDLSLLETPGRLGKIALSYPFNDYMLRLISFCNSVVMNHSECFSDYFRNLFFVDKVLPSIFWFPYIFLFQTCTTLHPNSLECLNGLKVKESTNWFLIRNGPHRPLKEFPLLPQMQFQDLCLLKIIFIQPLCFHRSFKYICRE